MSNKPALKQEVIERIKHAFDALELNERVVLLCADSEVELYELFMRDFIADNEVGRDYIADFIAEYKAYFEYLPRESKERGGQPVYAEEVKAYAAKVKQQLIAEKSFEQLLEAFLETMLAYEKDIPEALHEIGDGIVDALAIDMSPHLDCDGGDSCALFYVGYDETVGTYCIYIERVFPL